MQFSHLVLHTSPGTGAMPIHSGVSPSLSLISIVVINTMSIRLLLIDHGMGIVSTPLPVTNGMQHRISIYGQSDLKV